MLSYVVRDGWKEAFEFNHLPDDWIEPTDKEEPPFVKKDVYPWSESLRVGGRRDAVTQANGSFGSVEWKGKGTDTVVRVADVSTRFNHLSSKYLLAQFAREQELNHQFQVCTTSGWLKWDAFEFEEDPNVVADTTPGGFFLRDVSPDRPWVLKRDGASGGKGVIFVTSPEQVRKEVEDGRELEEALPFLEERKACVANWAAQRHIDRPMLLMDGHKFHLRAYVVGVGRRVFVYRAYEVRVAPVKWAGNTDFSDATAHITNAGGSESKHERRYLAADFPELAETILPRFAGFLSRVVNAHSTPEDPAARLDDTWIPAAVMGIDVMLDEDGNFCMLESNHSPASPPFDEVSKFGCHVRKFTKRLIALLILAGGGGQNDDDEKTPITNERREEWLKELNWQEL